MLSLALFAVALFLGLTLSSAVREAAYGYYLRYYMDAGLGRRVTAQSARAVAFVFGAMFYLFIAFAVCGLIYAIVLFVAYGYELFFA